VGWLIAIVVLPILFVVVATYTLVKLMLVLFQLSFLLFAALLRVPPRQGRICVSVGSVMLWKETSPASVER